MYDSFMSSQQNKTILNSKDGQENDPMEFMKQSLTAKQGEVDTLQRMLNMERKRCEKARKSEMHLKRKVKKIEKDKT